MISPGCSDRVITIDYSTLVSEPDPRTRKEGLKLAYINSLWDVASLQASYAIIEGVDWVQKCMCSISYCRPSLPVKILVTKRPFDSTLESTTATFGRQFKQPIAGKPGTVMLANEICVTCVCCGECLGYMI